MPPTAFTRCFTSEVPWLVFCKPTQELGHLSQGSRTLWGRWLPPVSRAGITSIAVPNWLVYLRLEPLLPGLQVATLQPAVLDGAKQGVWPDGCWGPELLRMGFGWEAVIVSPPQGETSLLSSHMWPLGPVAPGIFAGGIKMRDQLLVTGTGDAAGP